TLTKHASLSRTRRETLAWLVLLITRFGAASLWRLAAHVRTAAKVSSVRRRFYRFFQHVRLDAELGARIVASMLGLAGRPWTLAIDRTNWKLGKTEINILMISVEWRGIGVPPIFTVLPKAGNSNTAERVDLLDRLKRVFPEMKIAALTGDREFIGNAWMAHLEKEKIPFILRLKENQHVARDGYEPWPIERIAQDLKRGERMTVKGLCRLGAGGQDSSASHVRIVIMRLKTGELLALATNGRPGLALARYRARWKIETLFGNLKTRGFDLEATHITDPKKLETLLVIMSLAATLAAKTGAAAHEIRPIPDKAHGRRAVSLFALGLAVLRQLFARDVPEQVKRFLNQLLSPNFPIKPLIRLGF
ncbi:MAG: IS4 family transposase, partial [Pseudomonadota bacterium]